MGITADVPDDLVFGAPEESDAFELGIKSEWLDRRLRLNAALFYQGFEGFIGRFEDVPYLNTNTQTVSEGDVPDLRLHYHANLSPRMNVNTGDQSFGACYDENCTVKVLDNEVGTILIDVIDGHTNRLIWRGWAQNSVEGVIDHPTKFQARIQEAVTRMFGRFPRTL